MAIYNKRFEVKLKTDITDDPQRMLDELDTYFKLNLRRTEAALRWAIVDVKNGKLIIDATIAEEAALV